MLKSVVLPAPFGPIRPTTSPRPTSRLTSDSARSPPNRTDTPPTRRSAASGFIGHRRAGGERRGPPGKPAPQPRPGGPQDPDEAPREEHQEGQQERPREELLVLGEGP